MATLLFSNPGIGQAGKLSKGQLDLDSQDKILAISQFLAYDDFPKVTDILAVMKIESNFEVFARNRISRGLMQVNHGSYDIAKNISEGVELLRKYYVMLGSKRAAVLAYNAGPANYKRGHFKVLYWKKFEGAKHVFESDTSEGIQALFPGTQLGSDTVGAVPVLDGGDGR